MSTYVIDCSMVGGWFFEDEKDSESEKLLEELKEKKVDLIAPVLLQTEVANSLKNNVRRNRIKEETANDLLIQFLLLPIDYIETDIEVCLQTAFKYDLSVYDACYLSLALAGKILLLTKDKKLAFAYSSTVTRVSEPTVKYHAGPMSRKIRQKQLEKMIRINTLRLKEQLKAEQNLSGNYYS